LVSHLRRVAGGLDLYGKYTMFISSTESQRLGAPWIDPSLSS
jgi:hypothetical protein